MTWYRVSSTLTLVITFLHKNGTEFGPQSIFLIALHKYQLVSLVDMSGPRHFILSECQLLLCCLGHGYSHVVNFVQ